MTLQYKVWSVISWKVGQKGFPDTKWATTKGLFEDVSPSTAFSIHQLDIGQEISGYKERKRKENGVRRVVYGKERKKLVQDFLAICLVRCENDEVHACICWWKECVKKDGVKISFFSLFWKILEQGDQTRRPVPAPRGSRSQGPVPRVGGIKKKFFLLLYTTSPWSKFTCIIWPFWTGWESC